MNIKVLMVCALLAAGLAAAGGLVHPYGDVRAEEPGPLLETAHASPAIRGIIERACQNCHSQKTEWPWYSRFAPASWLLEQDVSHARLRFNLSHWGEYLPRERATMLSAIGAAARTGEMPPSRYTLLHPNARLSAEERQQLYEWTRTERRSLQSPSR